MSDYCLCLSFGDNFFVFIINFILIFSLRRQGESGKSTLFKQMQTIYGKVWSIWSFIVCFIFIFFFYFLCQGFSVEDRLAVRPMIHSNIIASIKTLCEMCEEFGEGKVAVVSFIVNWMIFYFYAFVYLKLFVPRSIYDCFSLMCNKRKARKPQGARLL